MSDALAEAAQREMQIRAAKVACPQCRRGEVHRDHEGEAYECYGQLIMALPLATPALDALLEAAQREMRERAAATLHSQVHREQDEAARTEFDERHAHNYAADVLSEMARLISALPLATPALDALEEQAMRRALEFAWDELHVVERDLPWSTLIEHEMLHALKPEPGHGIEFDWCNVRLGQDLKEIE